MGEGLQVIIYVIIAVCVILALALAGVLFYVWYKDNHQAKAGKDNGNNSDKPVKNHQTKLQGIESMSKFLAFDDIVDSMIVRKNRTQYTMVIQCKGINFDLLGEDEKLAVESGFIQFLNTLRFPVQLYIQSRSLNLNNSLEKYESRISDVRTDILKLDAQIKRERANGRLDLVRKLEFDRRRKENILEYGSDVVNYVARLSQNRNVLQQNTYVAVAYYTSEFGGDISNYSKEEVDNIAFSELYTRAQTLIRALSSSGVTGRVINSEELAELLYIAYNREDSELINIKKEVEAQYDSLYHTAKDILDKQKEAIEEKVDREAVKLTSNSLSKADRILKLREENREEIRRRAMAYVERYRGEMTDELYKETKRQIDKADVTKLDENVNSESQKEKAVEKQAERPLRTRRTATQATAQATAAGQVRRTRRTTKDLGEEKKVNEVI